MYSVSFPRSRTGRKIIGTVLIILLAATSPTPVIFAQAPEGGGQPSADTGGTDTQSTTPENADTEASTGSDGSERSDEQKDTESSSEPSETEDATDTDPEDDSSEGTSQSNPGNDDAAQDSPEENAENEPGPEMEAATTSEEDETATATAEADAAATSTEDEEEATTTQLQASTQTSASEQDDATTTPDNGDAGDDGLDGESSGTSSTSGGGGGLLNGDGLDGEDVEAVEEGENANGEDDAATSTGDAMIDTGNADAVGGTVNNTNFNQTNVPSPSSGQAGYGGDSSTGGGGGSSDSDDASDDTGTSTLIGTSTVDTQNISTTTNDMAVTGETGENNASTTGNASITTGDANSFGYLVSLFNIVVTNSQGGLIFLQNPLGPVLDLSSQIMGVFDNDDSTSTSTCTLIKCAGLGAAFNVLTDNIAEVYNSLFVRSGTGLNHATSTGSTLIDTGDASAFGSIVNIGNLQIVDSRYLVILMNNAGDLDGDIVLPPPDFFKELSTSALVNGNLHATTTNTAEVTNNGTTTADTGTNTATATDDASIDTGNADTRTWIVNGVNNNSIGGRPICFVVSVGGNWNGEVVGLPDGFSRQDTPLGEVICGAGQATRDHALPGNLNVDTTNYAKVFNEAVIEAVSGGNTGSGENVTIRTGNAQAFLQILNLVNQNIIGQDWIFALFTISGDWNGDLMFGSQAFWDEVNVQMNKLRGGGPVALRRGDAELSLIKSAEQTEITASSTVDYTIVIENSGDPAYRSTLVDILYDPEGNVIHRQEWELGTIEADEEITIEYTVFFSASTTPGIYRNAAFIRGVERHPSIETHLGNAFESDIATAEIEVLGNMYSADLLLGYEDTAEEESLTCGQYLTETLRFNGSNDPAEVLKLQKFLAEREGIDVSQTGVFDEETLAAVHAYQRNHAHDVLSPWGLAASTGVVYHTTLQSINEAMCEGADLFPLTDEQRAEIERFKVRFDDYRLTEFPEVSATPTAAGLPEPPDEPEDEPEPLSDLRDAKDRILAAIGTAGSDAQSETGGFLSWLLSLIYSFFDQLASSVGVLYASAFERE